MSSQFIVDNEGVGASGLLTMAVDASADKDFTQEDLDSNLTACVVSASNEVGMGADGAKLFGKVIAVSEELQEGTTIPSYCSVQARGVARLQYNPDYAPQVNQMVEVDGAGKVKQASAAESIAAGGHLCRGQVIAIDATNHTCDVWLG
jgi:hypothetical protein